MVQRIVALHVAIFLLLGAAVFAGLASTAFAVGTAENRAPSYGETHRSLPIVLAASCRQKCVQDAGKCKRACMPQDPSCKASCTAQMKQCKARC